MKPFGVSCLITRPVGDKFEVLAVSRKGNPDDLGLAGGKVEPDEEPYAAMVREAHEELRITVKAAEHVYTRPEENDRTAWGYRVTEFEGEPRAVEPDTWVGWVEPQRLLQEGCTFRDYNRGFFLHVGLIDPDETTESWPGFKPPLQVPRMEAEELRKFVFAWLGNSIFTDKHLRGNDQTTMLGSVFMPLTFGAFADYDPASLEQIGCIYEYIDKAGPMAINGYPMFTSLRIMHRDDWNRAREAILREQERRDNIPI